MLTAWASDASDLVANQVGIVSTSVSVTEAAVDSLQVSVALPAELDIDETRVVTTNVPGLTCDVPERAQTVTCLTGAMNVDESLDIFVPVVPSMATAASVTLVTAESPGAETLVAEHSRVVASDGLGTRLVLDGAYSVDTVGASFLTCGVPLSSAACDEARAGSGGNLNNDWPMVLEPDPTADLVIPTGATVAFAGLYWSGAADTVNNPAGVTSVALNNSVVSSHPITAQRVDSQSGDSVVEPGEAYQSFADVTSIVTSGAWTVGGASFSQGAGQYAGWALVVVLADPEKPSARVTVHDGFQLVGEPTDTGGFSSFTSNVAGRPGSTVDVNVVAWEGDAGIAGDTATLDGIQLTRKDSWVDVSDESNAFASSAKGSRVVNTFGVDVGAFNPVTMVGDRGQLSITSTGDRFYLGPVVVVSR